MILPITIGSADSALFSIIERILSYLETYRAMHAHPEICRHTYLPTYKQIFTGWECQIGRIMLFLTASNLHKITHAITMWQYFECNDAYKRLMNVR